MSRTPQHGGFSEEAIEKAKAAMLDASDFSEQQEPLARNKDGMPSILGFAEEHFDFGRCQRPDGTFYGTSGVSVAKVHRNWRQRERSSKAERPQGRLERSRARAEITAKAKEVRAMDKEAKAANKAADAAERAVAQRWHARTRRRAKRSSSSRQGSQGKGQGS